MQGRKYLLIGLALLFIFLVTWTFSDFLRSRKAKARKPEPEVVKHTLATDQERHVGVGKKVEGQPVIQVAQDGFPTGQNTPEGAACDFARAFIDASIALFKQVCLRPSGGNELNKELQKFINAIIEEMKNESEKPKNGRTGPKKIGKCFAARHLSLNGPASYGYAVWGFLDVMFVDVGTYLHDGTQYLNRTLIVKDNDNKWYVHPCPGISPLLSAGLNEETDSEIDFTEHYQISEKFSSE